ncbi:MAG: polysaccharide deacetylase family protein [Firmicutes bacterium]|nr:polysaccharide deacetylase family protein [Bacillota bacterium]
MPQEIVLIILVALLLFFPQQANCSSVLPAAEAFTSRSVDTADRNITPKRMVKPLSLRKIALTFDDGPDRINTPKILDILETENAAATFFVVGEKVERYPEVIERIFQAGHLIANHSRTHADLSGLFNEEIIELELDPTSKAVEKITGYYPKIMRPPYGSLRPDSVRFLEEAGWQIVRWSLDTFDWDKERNQPEEITERIALQHHPNAIILMHCNGWETVEALPAIINTLRAAGYDFVTVSQLLGLESEGQPPKH